MGILKTIGVLGLVAGAYFVGNTTKPNNVNGYSLQGNNQETILFSEELGKGYELNMINQEIYIGDAEHQYNGLRALTNYELVFGEIPFVGDFELEQSGIEKIIQKAEDLI